MIAINPKITQIGARMRKLTRLFLLSINPVMERITLHPATLKKQPDKHIFNHSCLVLKNIFASLKMLQLRADELNRLLVWNHAHESRDALDFRCWIGYQRLVLHPNLRPTAAVMHGQPMRVSVTARYCRRLLGIDVDAATLLWRFAIDHASR